ncbi:MAG: hypothetical protein R3B84_16190 [Zavarzinella sp.]
MSKVEQKSSQLFTDQAVSNTMPNIAENCTYDHIAAVGLEQLPKLLGNSHISRERVPKCGHLQKLIHSLAHNWVNLPVDLKHVIHELPDGLIELLYTWGPPADTIG